MSGVSPQLIDLRRRIAERIERKTEELRTNDEQLQSARDLVMELTLRHDAIVQGLAEDNQLLRDAAPKHMRTRKSETTGDQAGASENKLDGR